jgi:hypothetical protein
VFLSYRRSDSGEFVQHRLAEALGHRFGEENVFVDIDSIQGGTDWRQQLEHALDQAAVLVAVIGPHWLTATDETGKRRLDDENDVVATEIKRAHERGKPILPVLLDDTKMPTVAQLPPALQLLPGVHAVVLRTSSDAVSKDLHRLGDELTDLGVGWPWWLRWVRGLLLPISLRPTRRGSLLYLLLLLLVAAGVAAVIGGGIWNVAASGFLVDGPANEPHGWTAFAWAPITLLPLGITLVLVNARYRLLGMGRQVLLVLGFLLGAGLGAMLFYDVPWSGLVGVRAVIEAQPLSFFWKEFWILVLWSVLLSVPGFLVTACLDWLSGARGRTRVVGRLLLKHIVLAVSLVILFGSTVLFVFPLESQTSGRGVVMGICLRVALFFGLLQAGASGPDKVQP